MLKHNITNAKGTFKKMYEDNYSILQAIKQLNITPPEPLKFASSFTVNNKLKKILKNGEIDFAEIEEVTNSIHNLSIELDTVTLNFLATHRIDNIMEVLEEDPENIHYIREAVNFINIIKKLGLSPDLWNAQNVTFLVYRKLYQIMQIRSEQGDEAARQWYQLFDKLVDKMGIKLQEQSVYTPT